MLFRLWCLWSTVVRAPETSPTHQSCEILQRPPTSAYASSAPTPYWGTSSPRHRETPLSHAGWGKYCKTSHKGVMLGVSCFPFGGSKFTVLHPLLSSFLFADTNTFTWSLLLAHSRLTARSVCPVIVVIPLAEIVESGLDSSHRLQVQNMAPLLKAGEHILIKTCSVRVVRLKPGSFLCLRSGSWNIALVKL